MPHVPSTALVTGVSPSLRSRPCQLLLMRNSPATNKTKVSLPHYSSTMLATQNFNGIHKMNYNAAVKREAHKLITSTSGNGAYKSSKCGKLFSAVIGLIANRRSHKSSKSFFLLFHFKNVLLCRCIGHCQTLTNKLL